MKIRLNKATVAAMPEQVRALVTDWQAQYRKAMITVKDVDGFYAWEDARVTMINLLTGAAGKEQAAGEFAGYTRLNPCDRIPVPHGCVAVETGFHCGVPFLTIYQGTATVKDPGAVILENQRAGRNAYEGLTTEEIAAYNRRLMFGENDEAFPGREEWALVTD